MLWLLMPLLGGAAFHGLCVKFDWLVLFKLPVDGGMTLGGRRLFGANKTWRGIIAVAAGAAVIWELQTGLLHRYEIFRHVELLDYGAAPGFWFGFLLGGVAEAAELPNSFIKRHMNIPPGGTTSGLRAVCFFLWDQLDLLLGFWLVLAWVMDVDIWHILLSVLIVLFMHPLLSVLGFMLGVRTSMR